MASWLLFLSGEMRLFEKSSPLAGCLRGTRRGFRSQASDEDVDAVWGAPDVDLTRWQSTHRSFEGQGFNSTQKEMVSSYVYVLPFGLQVRFTKK